MNRSETDVINEFSGNTSQIKYPIVLFFVIKKIKIIKGREKEKQTVKIYKKPVERKTTFRNDLHYSIF